MAPSCPAADSAASPWTGRIGDQDRWAIGRIRCGPVQGDRSVAAHEFAHPLRPEDLLEREEHLLDRPGGDAVDRRLLRCRQRRIEADATGSQDPVREGRHRGSRPKGVPPGRGDLDAVRGPCDGLDPGVLTHVESRGNVSCQGVIAIQDPMVDAAFEPQHAIGGRRPATPTSSIPPGRWAVRVSVTISRARPRYPRSAMNSAALRSSVCTRPRAHKTSKARQTPGWLRCTGNQ